MTFSKEMLRLLPLFFTLLLAGCSDSPASKVRNTADLFLGSSSDSEFRDVVFLPPDLDKHKADRIVNQCIIMVNALDSRVTIHDIEVKGRWATIRLSSPEPEPESLIALHVDDEWRIFWDPAGTLTWGTQKWHSLLSEADWNDYRSIKKHWENKAEMATPRKPSD